MVRTDWDRILSVNPSSLTDDEIEDLCPAVIRCDVDEISDTRNLRVLLKLSQEMLQYKDNQVESLLLECGELKQTISTLRPEAAKRKKKELDGSDGNHETSSFSKHADLSESVNHEDVVQGKNKKIKILMAELESFEKENTVLKERLTTLTQEMEDATVKMNEMTEELSTAQIRSIECKERVAYLERENVALVNRIEEMSAQQIDRDKIIDEFGEAIDDRIAEWKRILDAKDAEINRLKENLSQSLMQSVSSAKEQNKSEIVRLNEEIERRDKLVMELQAKLSEAVVEINESATIIEKLKADAQKLGKSDRRKEHRDLLKKLQVANERISHLQNELFNVQEDAKLKSSKLCEVLATLRKYEDGNQALTDALNEIKELKIELEGKNEHVRDLVSVVNKLEMLNSYHEMEILSLREKLGMPEDESVSIQNTLTKRKEEAKKIEELTRQNKILIEENLEMKSDIRMLKYKLNKPGRELDFSTNTVDGSVEFFHSTKLLDSETKPPISKADIVDLKHDMQVVLEENEALRTGMHEILDSIRNQDGKSTVEIQSSTLERLLEALDVRHLAGWYHPAMRLQEHLNVVQGSNSELRGQLKQLRKELHRKDNIIQHLAQNASTDVEKLYADESENEKVSIYLSEMQKLQEAYQNEADEWEKQKNTLLETNDELKNELDKLKLELELYQENFTVLEKGEDELQRAFARKTKDYVQAATEALVASRKNIALQQLLNKESAKSYRSQKEAIKAESDLKRALAESNKRQKILECEIATLQSNLSNSVSGIAHGELREKYEEVCIKLRGSLENNLLLKNRNEIEALREELETVKREKCQLVEHFKKELNCDNGADLAQRLKEAQAKQLLEEQRADHVAKLYEISQTQLAKCEKTVDEIMAAKSELQDELIILHKKLSRETRQGSVEAKADEAEENNARMKIEVENLKRLLQVARDEAQLQYSMNSLKTLELDGLRHQILNLQAASEDKATISRLDFELASKKTSELELNAQKVRLENQVNNLEEELEAAKRTCDGLRTYVHDCRKQCENRCRTLADVIAFLQNQYAGSTPVTALDRISSLAVKVREERENVSTEMKKARECHESAKLQQEMLNNRLQIVESLKEILEQQIGSESVQDVMQRFAEYSQYTLNDFKYKRKITQLENDLQIANNKFMEYESMITNLEHDMIHLQKVWSKGQRDQSKIDTQSLGTSPRPTESKPVSTQAAVETTSTRAQTDPYTCCLDKKDVVEVGVQANPSLKETLEKMEEREKDRENSAKQLESKTVKEAKNNNSERENSIGLLHEQLNQALKLASDRSATLMKYESQISEFQAKVDALNKTIENKELQLTQKERLLEESKSSQPPGADYSDKLALKSTINSLQKLISQKEETIGRYQNLLKEDRDEHSRAACRLQEEIKSLRNRVQLLQSEAQTQRGNNVASDNQKSTSDKMKEMATKAELKNTAMREEEVARLSEQVSNLEADLNITKELSERWHRLAEERLKHMDRMRERLEEQHKSELESYRSELNKWQSEADALRKQLSENRMLLTTGNISLMKELQERDDKIHELTLTCQRLQNDIELMESATRSHQAIAQTGCDIKMHEITQSLNREQIQHTQTDLVRRQLQSLMEKEKMYKHEIADLKQRLSRRYMAVKTQEKKASQREIQLERKVKLLEEELEKAQSRLDREYLVQEVKKAKTAEELLLWEKQKKWQQTAEKLKEKLKEKTDEYTKVVSNYEKLRSVVACMEREKWYLKSKLKVENNTVAGNLSARPISSAQQNLMEDLQKECQTLRDRIRELTDRLENENSEQLLQKIAEQSRRIAALEAVSQGNSHVIDQLEKLEMTKDILEKMNLALETENFELRLELEKTNSDMPRLREKVEHLEKYIDLLKVEKSSDSSPRSLEKEVQEHGLKKSSLEMEKTIFTLKRIIEKLQAENKRLRLSSKKNHFVHQGKFVPEAESLQRQYEEAQKRIVALETDLQFAEQRVKMLETAQREDDELNILKQQLLHKSELLDKVKLLLSRAAMNEKTLRQRLQQFESRQTLSTIPECCVTVPTPE